MRWWKFKERFKGEGRDAPKLVSSIDVTTMIYGKNIAIGKKTEMSFNQKKKKKQRFHFGLRENYMLLYNKERFNR